MVWQDIFLSRMFSKDKLILAISKAFNVDKRKVKLIKDIEEIIQTDGAGVVCQTYKHNTDYPLRLSFYIIDEDLLPKEDQATVKLLSRELECDILMSDNSVNPFTMLHISCDGNVEQISIDIEKFEDFEEFYLE
ncbi:hypothetical protein [Acetivibrio clariflavus]|uniref:hypothetical protein n=1 Tax=Acetivibrio clariflavus TaxID=288965 RepID=UPI000487DBF4|nr:hypothetical protein [Acetivibrio clariflavus]HOQ01454.1 hypothetical protein [Acetivibrio clariflavus]